MIPMTCPQCGLEGDVSLWLASSEARTALLDLIAISVPDAMLVMQYIGLHAPAKRKLSLKRAANLIGEVLPGLQTESVEFDGRTWQAPRAAWRTAIQTMLDHRDAGKLTLSLSNHNYLYRILTSQANKAEAKAEQAVEVQRRTGAQRDEGVYSGPVNVDRGFTSVADILAEQQRRRSL